MKKIDLFADDWGRVKLVLLSPFMTFFGFAIVPFLGEPHFVIVSIFGVAFSFNKIIRSVLRAKVIHFLIYALLCIICLISSWCNHAVGILVVLIFSVFTPIWIIKVYNDKCNVKEQ